MDYFLTEEQAMIRDLCREIAEEKIKPIRAKYEREEIFPHDIMDIMAKSDLMGLYIPEAYGGMGGGIFEMCLAIEELSRACIGVSVTFAANALGGYPIMVFGTEEQKKKYLPSLASGEHLGAFGLTEANAGSDAAGIQTTAKKVGDKYVLNGTKQWITNGGEAHTYTIIAMTDKKKGARGATAFIVEKDTPGFSFGKKEDKMGIRTSTTRELVFEDCAIPQENILGREGKGFIIAMKNLDHSRPGIGAQGVGLAQGALDESASYARERIQFGKPVFAQQAVGHMLANMAVKVEASRALLYAVARYIDTDPKGFSKVSAISKLYATDIAMEVATDAVQVMGGYGYMKEYPVEKMMRDAKILQIYEGTNQIQRNVIAQELMKEYAAKKRK